MSNISRSKREKKKYERMHVCAPHLKVPYELNKPRNLQLLLFIGFVMEVIVKETVEIKGYQ